MLARLITALSHGTFFGVGAVIASNLVHPKMKAGAVSIMMAGLTIANIVGVPFGTFIGQQMGWRASFGAVVIMGLISLIGIIAVVPRIPQESRSPLSQQFRALVQPRLLLVLLTGALGCGSLFAVFTYIAPMLTQITGFAEHSVTWILVLFGFGVTREYRRRQAGGLEAHAHDNGEFHCAGAILTIFTFTDQHPMAAVITIFIWGVAAFGIFPGLQVRIMAIAKDAPSLASTLNHSALNLGNAGGAFLGGQVIVQMGLPSLPWIASIVAVSGLLCAFVSYSLEGKDKASSVVTAGR